MTVIINDFEVIVEQPEVSDEAGGKQIDERSMPQLSPQDIKDIVRHQVERMARLLAH